MDVVDTLIANHQSFLSFVERRVGNRAVAEEILQEAFVKSLDRQDQVRDSAIGWFYQVLRNTVIDYQKKHVVGPRRRCDREAAADEEGREQAHAGSPLREVDNVAMRAAVALLVLIAACGESDPPRPVIATAPYHDACDATMSCPEPYACVEGDAGHEDGTFCFVPCDDDADCPAGFFCNGVDVNADVGARDHCAEDV